MIVEKVIEIFAKDASKIIFDFLNLRLKTLIESPEKINLNVERKLAIVENWCNRIEFFGMTGAMSTFDQSIPLSFDVPRKFAPRNDDSEFSEAQLIRSPNHQVILGDPGSGKTTTLKRIVRSTIERNKIAADEELVMPVVVILREQSSNTSLYEMICEQLGVSEYCTMKDGTFPSSQTGKNKKAIYLGKKRLRDALPELLDQSSAILYLDGLDEVPFEHRPNLETEITHLARNLLHAKVVVTCRSGDFVRHMDGFDVVEICPLEDDQIIEISLKWLGNTDGFISEIRKFPSRDFFDRPLLLTQMLVIFKNAGYLPEQPINVYKRMLMLLIQEWDEQRQIHRKSAYANFDREQKYDFLCAIAYHLTCIVKVRKFSHKMLVSSYVAANKRFSLPQSEAKEVAREIENHTGIIVENYDGSFEFCHLTLQEFLCANYLIREPFADLKERYLQQYPAPLAVAVALSSNPSRWLAHLLLSDIHFEKQIAQIFFSRLITEKPSFIVSELLGLALLRFALAESEKAQRSMQYFLQIPNVGKSFSKIINGYEVKRNDEEVYCTIKRKSTAPIMVENTMMPQGGEISLDYMRYYKGFY